MLKNIKIGFLLLKISVQILSVILYLAKKMLYGQYFSCSYPFSLKVLVWIMWYSLKQKHFLGSCASLRIVSSKLFPSLFV